MRTQEEIIARIEKIEGTDADIFGFEVEDLFTALDFKHAKAFIKKSSGGKETLTKEEWQSALATDEAVIKVLKEYMEFAIEKATSHRGLSANRSITHYRTWLWLIGDDELVDFIETDGNYRNYGAPILKRICKKYKIKLPTGYTRKVLDAMAKGEACPGCQSGESGGCGE